jgi:hypothetical protein
MKKVKIMLLSLTILAVVGAALAFKAREITKFCTAVYNDGCPAKCPNLVTSKSTNESGPVYCTTTPQQTRLVVGGPLVSTCTVGGVDVDCNGQATTTIIPD